MPVLFLTVLDLAIHLLLLEFIVTDLSALLKLSPPNSHEFLIEAQKVFDWSNNWDIRLRLLKFAFLLIQYVSTPEVRAVMEWTYSPPDSITATGNPILSFPHSHYHLRWWSSVTRGQACPDFRLINPQTLKICRNGLESTSGVCTVIFPVILSNIIIFKRSIVLYGSPFDHRVLVFSVNILMKKADKLICTIEDKMK